jgi:molybdopterin-guanine dinucleotide biosynthesis protein A
MLDIPCILFAGGKSSRMGQDKSLLPFGEYATLTQFQLQKLQKIFTTVYISCKEKSKFNFDANFIEDLPEYETFAPTLGFYSVFVNLQCEKFFAISVDTPFISSDIIEAICLNDNNTYDAIIALENNTIHPLCGIYHISLLEKLHSMILTGNHKIQKMLEESHTNYVHFEKSDRFLNINNPTEYERALRLINTSLL